MLPQASLSDSPNIWSADFDLKNVPSAPWRVNLEDIGKKLASAEWSEEDIERGIEEYRRFLALKILHPEQALVPNKALDEVWHQHILDTRSYHADCERLFGRYMHHNPNFGVGGESEQKALNEAFLATVALYEEYFGTYPTDWRLASRCKDHSCHAPSACACRTPEACK